MSELDHPLAVLQAPPGVPRSALLSVLSIVEEHREKAAAAAP